jgi:hypothetical protein
MLKSIPSVMLKDTVVLKVPKGMDRWQNTEYDEYTISKVHLQSDNKTVISLNNSDVTLTGTLFIDGKKSTPLYDIESLQKQAHDNKGTMRAIVYNAQGVVSGDFNVLIVDGIPDVPATRIHHWELGLQ